MKRLISLLFAVVCAVPAWAGTIPVTGTIRLPNGNLMNGRIEFILSYAAARDSCSNNIVVASTISYTVNNGSLPSNAVITGNDCLQPGNTWYTARYLSSSGALLGQNLFYIQGNSFNIGTAVPTPVTTSNLSFNNFTNLANVSAATIEATTNLNPTVLSTTQTLTNSTVGSARGWWTVTDNSPPTGPAGVAFLTYIPDDARFTLNTSTGGQKVGANGDVLMEQGSTGFSYTTLTQSITASGSPQTVSVGNSAVFIPLAIPISSSFCITLNPNASNSECVTPSSIPDGTHFTAIFAQNHSNGEVVGMRYSSAQVTLTATNNDIHTDGTGTPGNNDIFAFNPSVQIKNATFHEADTIEADLVNNSGVDCGYVGDGLNTPKCYAMTAVSAGNAAASYGIDITSGSSSSRFKIGLEVGGASASGVNIVNNGAGTPTVGISIQAASTNGLVIGGNQIALSNPNFTPQSPTHAIYLTARTNGANEPSNDACWEERISSTNHVWCWEVDGSGNFGLYRDTVFTGTAISTDGSGESRVSTNKMVVTAEADDSNPAMYTANHAGNTVRNAFNNDGSAALATGNILITTAGNITAPTLIFTAATPSTTGSQLGLGNSTDASTNCGSLMGALGCIIGNLGGTPIHIPYF